MDVEKKHFYQSSQSNAYVCSNMGMELRFCYGSF